MAAYMLESTRLEPLPELLLLVPLENLCPMGATGTPVIVGMQAPLGPISTPFGTAGAPEFLHLEPLPGLSLLAPLGNLCLTGITSKPIGAAGLAPSGITSTPFETTGTLELGWPEPPSMPGWLGSLNILGQLEPPGTSTQCGRIWHAYRDNRSCWIRCSGWSCWRHQETCVWWVLQAYCLHLENLQLNKHYVIVTWNDHRLLHLHRSHLAASKTVPMLPSSNLMA